MGESTGGTSMWPSVRHRHPVATRGALWKILALGVALCAPGVDFPQRQTRNVTSQYETTQIGCGLAALLAVLSDHEPDAAVRLSQILAVDGGHDRVSSSFHDLATWAGRMGFEATGYQVESSALASLSLPAIAHLRAGHFVVVHSVNDKCVVVSERDARPYSMTRAGFERLFSGRVLCLQRRSTQSG